MSRLSDLSIKSKFIFGIVLILIITISTLSMVFIKQSENLLIEALEDKVNLLEQNFSIISAQGIQESSFSNLQSLINKVAAKDDEIKVLVVGYPNGIIIASSDREDFRQFSKIEKDYILNQLEIKESKIFRNKDEQLLESVSFISRKHGGRSDDAYEELYDLYWNDEMAPSGDDAPAPSEMETPFKVPENEIMGFIYIALDTTPLKNSISTLWVYSIMITLCLMAVGIIAAYWFGASMSKPIKALAADVRIIASGNLETSICSRSNDEIGQLVGDVETMRLAIKDLTDNLEAKVKERTRQLQEATEQLATANEEITALNDRLKEENIRMSAELDIARRLQEMILPKAEELKCIKNIDIVGFMEPADEVGGDYYDVLRYDGTVKIGIGDVTGHGLESGVLMLMTQTAVRTLMFSDETNPRRFLSILNRVIYDNVQRMNADKNLTLAMADYTPNNGGGRIRLSGQHEQMIVVRIGGKIELVDTIDLGFPIGLEDNISDFVDEETVSLKPGEGIVLYSDGITEAENEAGELYELERLCDIISRNWDKSVEEIKQAVIDDVHLHIGKQKMYDDLTLVVLKQQ